MKLISDQVTEKEIKIITSQLAATLARGIAGDVVEFGCYEGTTSLFIQKQLAKTGKSFHVYDSFEGLPAKTAEDESPAGEHFKAGELLARKAQFVRYFKQFGLPLPVIHKAWFADLTTDDVPEHIMFAFLDGDYYHSILDPLRLIWPRLADGAVVVVDDYQNEQLPGVKKALDVWGQHHRFTLRTEASLAILSV